MNMGALDFDDDMWEYCDSELRAVEASGESRDALNFVHASRHN